LFDVARELNKVKEVAPETASVLAATLKSLSSLLGILQENADSFLKGSATESSARGGIDSQSADGLIEQQIQARIDAKKAKNWALADQIRDELKEQGIILEDSPNGTTSWRRE